MLRPELNTRAPIPKTQTLTHCGPEQLNASHVLSCMKITLLALILAACAFAAAQDSGPPSAGPSGGAPVLRSLNQPDEGGRLLAMPAVQEDLQLTDAQKTQLKDLLRNKTSVQTSPKLVNEQIREILTPDQFKRLEQIRLQVAGLMALAAPRLAKKLQITDDQANKIQTIVQKARDEQKAESPKPLRPFIELRDKVEPMIRALLTVDQLAAWQTLIGKPFVMGTPRNAAVR